MLTFNKLGRYGRFANQLYQIAGVIGIATKNNHSFSFPQWINWDHKESFGSKEDCDIYKHLVNELPLRPDINFQEMFVQWGYHDVHIPLDVAISIDGHLQSPRYFNHCPDLVKHHLKFKNEPDKNDLCAIHWRAGDYIDDPNAYHPRQPKEYYYEAIKHMPANTKYLVFSDNLDKAKEMFSGIDAEYSEGNDYIQDYLLMKSCKHFIIANSSYSAFAATISDNEDKIVVAPRKWFGPVAGINGDDIYEANWIVL
jgi:hypothetical protein